MAKHPCFDRDLTAFFHAEEGVLRARLEGIRAAISHPGEKGRKVETEVASLLRDFLPAEYGIGTGFIAYHDSRSLRKGKIEPADDRIRLSEQLDIIIYDALRSGPLAQLGSCAVFPLEAVYAYVEVKTALSSPAHLTELLAQSDRLRSMDIRVYRGMVENEPTGAKLKIVLQPEVPSIRSYVVVMDGTKLGTGPEIQRKLQAATKAHKGRNTFLSGLYINGIGFFCHQPVARKGDPRIGEVLSDLEHPLLTLKNSLYINLSRYPRVSPGWSPAIDLYALEREIVSHEATPAEEPAEGRVPDGLLGSKSQQQ